jgi:hypothetical protein
MNGFGERQHIDAGGVMRKQQAGDFFERGA